MTTSSDITPDSALADDYRRLADGFVAILDDVPADRWSAPSPCDGWTARDVVGHVIETQRDFLSRHEVDLGDQPDLADPPAAWRSHSGLVATALADPAIGDKSFDGHFGPTTVGETLLRFYGFDIIAHRWDVAAAAGQSVTFTDDELDTLETAAAGFGPALYADGVCKEALDVPADADRQTRLLATLGRSA
ncbi:TIGR03086 family metal-binding protein [Gordonia sp. CPCC 205515]|uniref:TIGR03086 family metal-binding protein n=1 Tax=Gordonia sp. CPCC 205515 TaxID=3140791 RepID=UPI003AF3ED50